MQISGFVAYCIHVHRLIFTYQCRNALPINSQFWMRFPGSPLEAAKAPAFAARRTRAWFLPALEQPSALPGRGRQWAQEDPAGRSAGVRWRASELRGSSSFPRPLETPGSPDEEMNSTLRCDSAAFKIGFCCAPSVIYRGESRFSGPRF